MKLSWEVVSKMDIGQDSLGLWIHSKTKPMYRYVCPIGTSTSRPDDVAAGFSYDSPTLAFVGPHIIFISSVGSTGRADCT